MTPLDALLAIAVDLTAALTADDRYRRLLEAVRRAVPCDAAALLKVEGNVLIPVAAHGLTPDTLGRRFARADHPRLHIICSSEEPVLFPRDTQLPDPFDGLLADDESAQLPMHACLGCPLLVEGQLVGVLTADALRVDAFDGLDRRLLGALGALAGAAMQTTFLIEALQRNASRQGLIAKDLMRDQELRQGGQLIGQSPAMQRLRQEIELTGPSDFTVLVVGETGVGKELVVRAIHAASRRAGSSLTYVNCAALPESLADSELFGHVRGAFTGAGADRHGKFDVADGGTLFLDEIGELPESVQPKLLRALQQGEIQRVGADQPLHVDVRVLAATNRNLDQAVGSGRFRADLFHRLNVYPLRVPPLREHPEDIPMLAGHFCDQTVHRLGLGQARVAPDALRALQRYDWPGNVRELENVVSRMVLKAAGSVARGKPLVLHASLLGSEFFDQGAEVKAVSLQVASVGIQGAPLREAVEQFQRTMIQRAVDDAQGNWAAASRILGMNRGNLHHLASRLGLK